MKIMGQTLKTRENKRLLAHTVLIVASMLIGYSPVSARGPAQPVSVDAVYVDCAAGDTVNRAVRKAKPGDTIYISGTCSERVIITKDRLTLDGQGTATLDGGGGTPTEFDAVVTVDGARGITIKGLTIQNGPGEGILGTRGAAFVVLRTTVRNNGAVGIEIAESSTVEITDCSLQHNAVGMDVVTGSSAVLMGTIDITENATGGLGINGTSIVEVRGAHVDASRNGGFGVVAGSNSQLAFFGFAGTEGSTLTVDRNTDGGIALGDSVLNVFSSSATITVTNSPVGIIPRGPGSSIISPFGAGTFIIEHNVVGLDFRLDGTAIFRGGLNVRNNGTGVRTADGAGVLWFISIPPNPSAITGNGVDVELQFGARATFAGVAVGTIKCDGTVLLRGATCTP
jgi:hypothetical protein